MGRVHTLPAQTANMGKSNKKHLKKIPVEQLRSGMFLNEICGSWMDHPFWNTKFLIQDPADLKRLQTASIKEVWIDTARGLDTESDVSASEKKATTLRCWRHGTSKNC